MINLDDTALTTRSIYDEVIIPDGAEFIPEQPGRNGICNLYGIVKTGTPIPDGIEYEVLAEYYNPCEDALQTLDAESAASVMERLQPQTRAEGSTISGNISLVDDIAGKNAPVAHVQLILSCTEASGVVRSETVYTDGSRKLFFQDRIPDRYDSRFDGELEDYRSGLLRLVLLHRQYGREHGCLHL